MALGGGALISRSCFMLAATTTPLAALSQGRCGRSTTDRRLRAGRLAAGESAFDELSSNVVDNGPHGVVVVVVVVVVDGEQGLSRLR